MALSDSDGKWPKCEGYFLAINAEVSIPTLDDVMCQSQN